MKRLFAKQNLCYFTVVLLLIFNSACSSPFGVDRPFGTSSPTAKDSSESPKDITTFSILGVNGAIVGKEITVTLPSGTSVAYLTPTIVQTGSSVSPASGVVQNFTSPQTYIVTAADGTTKDYTVTVTVSANSAKELTTFSILGMNGAIVGQEITVTLPYGTNVSP